MERKIPSGSAGGFPALGSSLKHLVVQKAVRKGSAALLRMNQPEGFDCPGCAWPEPKKTSMSEFCENGVKAIAAETTGKKIDAAFLEQHSVTQLLEKDGYWLEQEGRLTEQM